MNKKAPYTSTDVYLHKAIVTVGGKRCRTGREVVGEAVERVVETVAKIIATKDTLFRVVVERKRKRLAETPLGSDLRRCLRTGTVQARLHYRGYKFNPLFELFERIAPSYGDLGSRPQTYDVPALNRLVGKIREEGRKKGFKNALRKEKLTTEKNRLRLLAALSSLRRGYSRVMFVRIDTGYKSEFGPGGIESARICNEKLHDHLERFFRHLVRGPFKKKFLWYAWKREGAQDKGPHCHFLVAFDGRLLRKDGAVAYLLGKHWVDVITGGKGTSFNCNARKRQRYPRVGIGWLRRDDDEAWEVLLNVVAAYMTKQDPYFRLDPPGKSRAFGMSALPNERGKRRPPKASGS